jgi:hypothetical protein
MDKTKKTKLLMSDTEYFNYKEPLISLEFCPNGGFQCHQVLIDVNSLLSEANSAIENKDYNTALNNKVQAFEALSSLKLSQCLNCRDLLKDYIIKSTELISLDLKKMTTGIFRNKHFLPQLKKTEEILIIMNEFSEGLRAEGSGG